MRIAIFSDAFLPQINGVATHVIETATKLVERGHTVLVFVPKPARGIVIDRRSFPFEIVMIPSVPAFVYPDVRIAVLALPKYLFALKKFHAEIVHVQDPFTVGTEGIMAAKVLKLPIVITFHTFFLDEQMLEDMRLGRIAPLIQTPLWKLIATYHNVADAVICPSHVAKKELIERGLKKPVIVVSNGIDLSKIHPVTKKEARRRFSSYSIKEEDKVGIFVGRLAKDKSVDILLASWKEVVKKIPDAKLVLVGDGPEEKSLRAYCQKEKLQSNIVFCRKVEREEMIQNGLLYIADFFVTASKIENQSYAILEAMAHGLPIVAVNMRGTPELVDYTNGILVAPDSSYKLAEAIVSLLQRREQLAWFKKGSLQKIVNFDLDKTVQQLEKVYLSLLKQS